MKFTQARHSQKEGKLKINKREKFGLWKEQKKKKGSVRIRNPSETDPNRSDQFGWVGF